MPFKTRKHKESAASRRVDFIENGLVTYRAAKFSDSHESGESAKKSSGKVFSIENSYDYVRSELTLISILAIIIIGLQLALKIFKVSIF